MCKFENIGGLTDSSAQRNLYNEKTARVAVIADVDVREVNPSCIDVHKQGGSAAVIVDPSCVDVHKRGGGRAWL